MARFLFVTWDGGGNQPPTIGIAQALSRRGNEVAFPGYRSQQDRFRVAGFDLLQLPRAPAWTLMLLRSQSSGR